MKTNCKEIQESLYTIKNDGDDSEKWNLIFQHIDHCVECKSIYEKILKADSLIERIKITEPRFEFEESLTRSIIKKINDEKYSEQESLFDYFINLISTRSVKFAFTLVLLISTLSFVFMEYNDTKQIVSLEQKLGKSWNQKMTYAGVIQEEEGVLNFFYGAYKLLNGKSSYMEINRELVLLKKKDLLALFDDYGKLDEETKSRLDEMRVQFLKDTSLVRSSGFSKSEITSLRKEVEQLTKELEQRKNQRGLK